MKKNENEKMILVKLPNELYKRVKIKAVQEEVTIKQVAAKLIAIGIEIPAANTPGNVKQIQH